MSADTGTGGPLSIGLDLGTTGIKAAAVTAGGTVVQTAAREVSLRTDASGRAEQDVEAVWRATVAVLGELGSTLGAGRPAAIGVSGAMHSLVGLAEGLRPVGGATTWADQRAASDAAALAEEAGPDRLDALYRRTGCPFSPLYHLGRLRWWRRAHPEAERFAGIKELILHRLTGGWGMDESVASATGLLDIHGLRWDAEALALAGVSWSELPPVVGALEGIGGLSRLSASATGLPAGLPVIAGGSDGALANVGAGAWAPGRAVVTLGTSGAVRQVVSAPTVHAKRRTWCYVVEGGRQRRYLAGGAINSGGLVLQHVAEQWYGDEPAASVYARMEAEAAGIEPGAEGLMLLPFVAGERGLIWTPNASWELVGYDASKHGRGHVARAAMEAVAYCLAGLWTAVEEAQPAGMSEKGGAGEVESSPPAGAADGAIRLTGGVVRSTLWRQIVADVLDRRLAPVEAADASVMGAAWYGFRGAGVEAAAPSPEAERVIEPDAGRAAYYQAARRRFMDLCAERGWLT